MEQLERLERINEMLLEEMPEYRNEARRFGKSEEDQFELYRSLVNVRPAWKASEEFLELQDAMLSERNRKEGIVHVKDLEPSSRNRNLYLWQGDITRLDADAIVNAANSQMLGCFIPAITASTTSSTQRAESSFDWNAPGSWMSRNIPKRWGMLS